MLWTAGILYFSAVLFFIWEDKTMSLINISNLTFAYEDSYDNIFENVSFNIDTNWKLGFIGRNGRGKTTFLNLLLGKYEYSGRINASVAFEYFPFDVADTGIDTIDVVNEITNFCPEWQIVRELSLLDVEDDVLYRPFETLSKGEQGKVMLAALFLKENSFLLIDEPTNHLDIKGREIVSKYLNKKRGFILVSHDRDFLDGCVDHILSINRADIEVQKGNFSSWLINKERQDNYELAENEKLNKEVKILKRAAKKAADWSDKAEKSKFGTKNSGSSIDRGYVGHKAAKMMKRSKNVENRLQSSLEKKSKLLKNIENSDNLKILPLVYHKSCLLRLENVSIYYGEKCICKNISFDVERGERVALCGKNGCGKSSILKLIKGDNIKYTGNFNKGSQLVISYVSQDTSHLKGNLSDYIKSHNIDESLFKAILRKMDFSREQFDKDMGNFSGGQKKKILIAESLCERAHIYIWDEPLNFIDVISRMQIENLISEFKPTVLFVEHDKAFCDNVATKKVLLN